ncbi:MAG: SH3 domain-containing protein [Saprospiraceae bacterium]|nr:SH3 domain-containing protein [Saprospiraceae bacterium]
MKKILLTTLALIASISLFAQESDGDNWMRSEGSLEGFVIGSHYFTMVSDANLRERSNTQSTVITKLPIGTPLEIVGVSTDSLSLRGVKLPWVQVRTKSPGQPEQAGYLWGGFLALASIHTPNDEYTPNAGVKYLTGVAAYDELKHQITVQVRVAKEGKELSKCEFNTSGDLSYYPSFEVSFEPFQKVKAVLSVNYYYPACGYPSGNNLLFWQENNQLTKVLETSSVSEGGVFYDSEESILPTQRGGIGDHIVVTHDHSEFEEKGEDLVRSSQKFGVTVYKWNGAKLLKVKEIK